MTLNCPAGKASTTGASLIGVTMNGWSSDHKCWLPKLFRVEDNAAPQERKAVITWCQGWFTWTPPAPWLLSLPAVLRTNHTVSAFTGLSMPLTAPHLQTAQLHPGDKKEQTPPKSCAAKFQYQNTTTRIWEKIILTSIETQMLNSWTKHWYTKSRNKQKREYTRPIEVFPRNSRLFKYL